MLSGRLIPFVAVLGIVCGLAKAAPPNMLDGNLQVVDLSDLIAPLPLSVNSSTQILWQTQNWEHSSYGNTSWPAGGHESLGYPTMVKNTRGLNPDGKYYLYYAHHDPMSGIGAAVAGSIGGPYTKAAIAHEVLGTVWTDSQALVNPNYRPASLGGPNPGGVAHFSSPSVVWNQEAGLWYMYFHYFNHYWGGAGGEQWNVNNPGMGYQMTALATTPDLSSHNWTIWTDPAWDGVSVWDIVPVLPTTDEEWMESGSSYHAIQRLPEPLANGHEWLGFLRGTATTGLPTVGFGTSTDGRTWDYFAENPVIAPGKTWTVDTTQYRPKFIGYLGKNGSNEDEYLVAWAEHSNPHIIYSKTTDFINFERDSRGYAGWGTDDDGIVSAWREGNTLYLFSQKSVHEMDLSGVILEPGDADGDGKVDSADLAIWQQNYDVLGLNENTFSMGDWNYDGLIDSSDLALWQQNYDPIGGSALVTHTPEPGTLLVLGLGGLVMFRRRRK